MITIERSVNPYSPPLLYPASWLSPLARTGFLSFFSGNEINNLGGVTDRGNPVTALPLTPGKKVSGHVR